MEGPEAAPPPPPPAAAGGGGARGGAGGAADDDHPFALASNRELLAQERLLTALGFQRCELARQLGPARRELGQFGFGRVALGRHRPTLPPSPPNGASQKDGHQQKENQRPTGTKPAPKPPSILPLAHR